MIVFHGSYTKIENPEVGRGRDKVDFGKGFYLTRLRDQASTWAVIVQIAVLNQKIVDRGLRLVGCEEVVDAQ